ncbi:GntR family transcriptional regulator [Ammoniphilus resinae]|uniref:DNA-binding GntR family transcriptional regulator n=1 Tax=Ammoniphilus resinae TaxID=861532 RepID=A0ABS4GLZ2_9BACL|nr:GntR family transcriptional regulator [Ammoniphilus resinae]MBP1931286.1 DNA-binding GntR family transcriptional regulator [Ammoniphilus resinae]
MQTGLEPKKRNLYEQVYLSIKNAIVNGEFLPGQKLAEAKIADQLETSRTPVREALRRLEREGLVTFIPSQGAEVTPLSKGTMAGLFECRAALEGLAARKAVAHISKEELSGIEESLLLASHFLEMGDLKKVIEKNTYFHDVIILSSKNPPLQQMMEQIRTQILRYRRINSKIGFRSYFLAEHKEIFQAIVNRDADKAEELMKNHVLSDLNHLLTGLSFLD